MAGAEAGAAGLPSVLELPSPEAAGFASPAAGAAGFAEEYRSLYQPEPLNWMAGAVRVRSRVPLQCGHTVRGPSENFWIFSTRR